MFSTAECCVCVCLKEYNTQQIFHAFSSVNANMMKAIQMQSTYPLPVQCKLCSGVDLAQIRMKW